MEIRRVVIIEDNPDDYESVHRSLQSNTSHRCRFEHFSKGAPALEYLKSPASEVNLVVLDWRLPDMTAPELLRQLLGKDPIPRFPIIVLTGSSPPDNQKFLHQGVQDYFEKTLLMTGLLPRIADNAVERHKLMRRLVESEIAAVEAERVAEVANRAKSTFLANMSHELRTPMTAVLGIAELLLDKVTDVDQREMLQLIRGSGQHLADLLSDILDLAKIEAATLEVDPIECEPFQLVQDLCKVMEYPAADKGLTIQLHSRGECPRIWADATRLRQILLNLVGNAIKFTNEGFITVEMEYLPAPSPGRLKINVTDTGPGIPAGSEESIFDRFFQVETAREGKRDGVGLGLPISRSLARLMGGDLTLKCAEGKGCRFELVIAAPAVERPQHLQPTDGKPDGTEVRKRFHWGGRQILVVEDTHANQFLLRSLLKPTGAVVECVDNGLQAIKRYNAISHPAVPIDVILMDMQMPVMDGFEAVNRLRQEGCACPIIAITAGAAASDRERCLEVGCQDYISKPFNRDLLLQVIDRLLQGIENSRPDTASGQH